MLGASLLLALAVLAVSTDAQKLGEHISNNNSSSQKLGSGICGFFSTVGDECMLVRTTLLKYFCQTHGMCTKNSDDKVKGELKKKCIILNSFGSRSVVEVA